MNWKYEIDRYVLASYHGDFPRIYQIWNPITVRPSSNEPAYIVGQYNLSGDFQGEHQIPETMILGYVEDCLEEVQKMQLEQNSKYMKLLTYILSKGK